MYEFVSSLRNDKNEASMTLDNTNKVFLHRSCVSTRKVSLKQDIADRSIQLTPSFNSLNEKNEITER